MWVTANNIYYYYYKNRSIFNYDLRKVLTIKMNSLESNVVSLNCVRTKLSKTQFLLYSTNRKKVVNDFKMKLIW